MIQVSSEEVFSSAAKSVLRRWRVKGIGYSTICLEPYVQPFYELKKSTVQNSDKSGFESTSTIHELYELGQVIQPLWVLVCCLRNGDKNTGLIWLLCQMN